MAFLDTPDYDHLSKYPIKSFFIHLFFREQRRNPAFSLTGGGSFREKAGFLSLANIENLWLGT
ncbi:Uncharacterized protein dnm_018010 [Desulfonema magnum]|uniref:Uncharacterized protein n=1 Tax=Desulfonema magnum TaxID=45655 RepID=A0A975BHY2_9BACT|nr:Uncharacterized protein dnm_018010 [Desulfonema magnum]